VRDENGSFQNVAAYSDLSATLTVDGQPEKERGEIVTAGYFPLLGVNASIGRVLLPEEDRTPGAHPVVILGHHLWKRRCAGDPAVVGTTVYINKSPFTIIGVLPPSFRGQSGAADPSLLVSAVRREVAALDNTAPIYDVTTMNERAAKAISRYRYSAVLMGLFAGLALLLAAIGIYGVIGYGVSSRTRELGIRLALGAEPWGIVNRIMMDGAVLILIGLVVGVAAALATTRVLTSQLYQVRPTDPTTFATTALVLIVIAMLACYLPARRASRVDPTAALRTE
jgi:hypothetical protein